MEARPLLCRILLGHGDASHIEREQGGHADRQYAEKYKGGTLFRMMDKSPY
jgi:hypothetical protein